MLILTACGTGQNDVAPPSDDDLTENDTQSETPYLLFPYDGKQLCCFENDDPSAEQTTGGSYSSLLYFDYASEKYSRIALSGYRKYNNITPAAPVLWNDSIVIIECRAFRSPAYQLFEEQALSRIFLVSPESGDVSALDLDDQYYIFGSPVWGISGDDTHIMVTGCKDQGSDTLLLKVDMSTGLIEDLGVYTDSERKKPRNELSFSNSWYEADGFTYGYRGTDVDAQMLYRKETYSSLDYTCLVEDCYPDDYYNPYTGSFRVIGETVYYYGVSPVQESPATFAYDLTSGAILKRSRENGEYRMPVDRYGDKLIVSYPEQLRNGAPLSADDIGIIKESEYMEIGTQAYPFALTEY